jgi:hypothetical protein
VLCQLFFQRRLTDLTILTRLRDELTCTLGLNDAVQKFLREWSRVSRQRNEAVLLDQARLGWFAELNRGLRDELDDAGFKARIRENTALLKALAGEIVSAAMAEHPQLDAAEIRKFVPLDYAPSTSTSLLFPRRAPARSVAA